MTCVFVHPSASFLHVVMQGPGPDSWSFLTPTTKIFTRYPSDGKGVVVNFMVLYTLPKEQDNNGYYCLLLLVRVRPRC